jgi:hypothetical protein
MKYERLAWVGNLALAAVAIVLAWVPVKDDVGRWGSIAIAVVVVLGAIALFPRKRADGSEARLIDRFRSSVTTGNNSDVQVARDHVTQTITRESGKSSNGHE